MIFANTKAAPSTKYLIPITHSKADEYYEPLLLWKHISIKSFPHYIISNERPLRYVTICIQLILSWYESEQYSSVKGSTFEDVTEYLSNYFFNDNVLTTNIYLCCQCWEMVIFTDSVDLMFYWISISVYSTHKGRLRNKLLGSKLCLVKELWLIYYCTKGSVIFFIFSYVKRRMSISGNFQKYRTVRSMEIKLPLCQICLPCSKGSTWENNVLKRNRVVTIFPFIWNNHPPPKKK